MKIGKIIKEIVISKNPDLKNDIDYILADENTHKQLPPLKEGIGFLIRKKMLMPPVNWGIKAFYAHH